MEELLTFAVLPSILIGLICFAIMVLLSRFPSTRHLVDFDPKNGSQENPRR